MHNEPLKTGPLAYGCWRLATSGDATTDFQTTRTAVMAALECGFTFFDHADIYCDGRSETAFGRLLRESPGLRARVQIATKCGIRPPAGTSPYRYDSTYEHIVQSCEGSLRRLGVEMVDLYQLHRADWLMEPVEVARAFAELRSAGKVRRFGVSNFRPSQVDLLQAALNAPLAVNQVEVSLLQLGAFEDGTLDQCQARGIVPLAWSPLGGGMLGEGGKDLLPSQRGYSPSALVAELDRISLSYGVTRSALALAWLRRHPSGMVPIVGSTHPERIRQAAQAAGLQLSREDWYRLLAVAKGGSLP